MNNSFENQYVVYHLHSDYSLLDSCTDFKDYINKAVELGQKAICFTEHGNIYNWCTKKIECEKAGLKYLHGCEVYLTKQLEPKIRDNYHTILIAKNYEGVKEINKLISISNQDDHFYFKPRITFDEFLNTSNNVIKISACLASPLNQLPELDESYNKILLHYDYLEVQPHINSEEQKQYNKKLFELSKKYSKPLIAGTDTHSLNKYKAECRSILQLAKGIDYALEDTFDLTYKSYDELVDMFKKQNCLMENVYLEAIDNTNKMADSVEEFELDVSFKYPKVYEDDVSELKNRLNIMLIEKIEKGIIPVEEKQQFITNLREEVRVFEKIQMCGFMLFMSDLIKWCHDNNIPTGPGRGSCCGSSVAYVLDIIDVNPVKWNTVFSRFANEDRKEIGDIDTDFAPDDRDAVYNHMIETFGEDYTDYILAIGTVSDKGCIDEIGRALHKKTGKDIYSLENMKKIKKEYETNPDKAKEEYSELFYYFDGMINTKISQSMHPCGMVVSPITLPDNYGELRREGKKILQIDMEAVHEVSLVKYDLLGLANVGIIKDACKYANIPYPKSNEINWFDENVWNDMIRCPQGIFQFEGAYAFQMLCEFKPKNLFDMSLVTAALRPSGASYRNELMKKQFHKNPSSIIDDMLKDNYGFLVYQEDTIKFLKDVCGLSGSDADNIRRAIGRKQKDRLEAAMPSILEGYCKMSSQPRNVAESEAKEFLQIIEDSASYQFGYNHSLAYCMVGYLCAYLRYYYPAEFTTSYLNNSDNDSDIVSGYELARAYNIPIKPPRFRHSLDKYVLDKNENTIYKGVASIKFLNATASNYLYSLRDNKYNDFVDLLIQITNDKDDEGRAYINSRQLEILIKLQFFEEFGHNGKLLDVYKAFTSLYGRKVIQKDKISELPVSLDIVAENALTETDKQYRDVNIEKILHEYEKSVPNNNLKVSEQIKFEMEILGYINTTYPEAERSVCLVKDVDTKFTPKATIYCLKNGKEIECKINKKTFKAKPFKKNSLIKANEFEKKPKWIKVEEGFEKSTTETEWHLTNYQIIEEGNLC